MSRKHYVAIAATFAAQRREIFADPDREFGSIFLLGELAAKQADVFATDNPNFDRGRFLAACREA